MDEKKYYLKKEIFNLVKLINWGNSVYNQWSYHQARKNYMDLFGQKIEKDEKYWRLVLDQSHINDIKLAESSMNKFIHLIFSGNPNWIGVIEEKILKEHDKARNIINNLRK